MSGVFRGKWFSGSIYGLLLICSIFLSNCDMMGGSVDEFIEYNTGNASLNSARITSLPEGEGGVVEERDPNAWLHNTTHWDGQIPNVIKFEVKIENPQNYDLAITPVIYEYTGESGETLADAPEIKIISQSSDRLTVQIGSEESDKKKVKQGDSFRVRIDMATKDGTRTFDSYIIPYKIIFDNSFKYPWGIDVKSVSEADREIFGYSNITTWTMQASQSHRGINKITVKFISNLTDADFKELKFERVHDQDEDGKDNLGWKLTNIGEMPYELRAKELDTGVIECQVPFPLMGDSFVDTANVLEESYSVLITLEDKNGLSRVFGGEDEAETLLGGLQINYLVGDAAGYEVRDSGEKFDISNQSPVLVVPYHVQRVEFIAQTHPEIFGQKVRWITEPPRINTGTYDVHEPKIDFPVIVGPQERNSFHMFVYWRNPNDKADLLIKEYVFKIQRLSPSMDSTLKNLVIQNSSPTDKTDFEPIGKFIKPVEHPDNIGDDYKTKTDYTVHIPSSVNKVKIRAQYLNTSTTYFKQNGASVGTHITTDDIQIIDHPNAEYPEDDYKDRYPLKIVEHVWESPDLEPGYNTPFNIEVKPESDDQAGTKTRRYTLTIIKAVPGSELTPTLNDIEISAGGESLLGDETKRNRFIPHEFDYTVLVPSGVSSVNLAATTAGGTKILEATSDDPGQTFTDEDPADAVSYKIDTAETDFDTKSEKVVRLEVYKDDGTNAQNTSIYTVTFIKCFPDSTMTDPPELVGGKNSLNVSWTLVTNTNAAGYELYFSPYSDKPDDNHPELADKWHKEFSDTTTKAEINGLNHNTKYNVWVRAKNGDGIPGNWNKAQTTPQYGSPVGDIVDYGTTGAAELKSLSFTQTQTPEAAYVPRLSPAFSSSIDTYTLTLAGDTTDSAKVKYTTVTDDGVDAPTSGEFTVPASGTEKLVTITALSPDKVTPKDYKVTIKRKFPAPAAITPTAESRRINLTWAPVNGATSYDIFYAATSLALGEVETKATKLPEVLSPTTTTVIPGLTNGTRYHVWVRAKNSVVTGEFINGATTPNDGEPGITIPDLDLPENLDGEISFTIKLNGTEVPDGTTPVLSWGAKTLLEIAVNAAAGLFTSYQWYFDDTPASDTANDVSDFVGGSKTTLLRVSARRFSAGTHTISVRAVHSGGKVYSRDIEINVQR